MHFLDHCAVFKFSNHPSILKIKDHCQNVGSFHFQKVTPDAVDREVRDLNPKKATRHKNIPPKILKSNSDVCVESLTKIFNDCIEHSSFPNELNCADVTSLPKNGPSNTRTNFRPNLKVRSCGKCYQQRYEIRNRFVSLKQRSKIGTGKIAHADYAELLFRIWAFYDKQILDFCFYTVYF